jgi:urease accessory protein UreH
LSSDHVSTAATGHQRAEERVNRRLYLQDRERKLEQQIIAVEDKASGGILSGCRIYIDGYLEDTTDMEMKRTISLAGGQVLYAWQSLN